MKRILLIGAMMGILCFICQAQAGVVVSVGVGGPLFVSPPYYYGYGGPMAYYGPGYYPWYHGYWGGGYYRGYHGYYGHGGGYYGHGYYHR